MNTYLKHCLLFAAASSFAFAQLSGTEVRQRLDLIHSGKIDQVRSEVASLLRQMPNDPGVRYLDAYVTDNGDQAMRKYQLVVDQFPGSEWADDALYKVYQYYFAVGLYKTAEAKMNQLNQQYPNSIYSNTAAKPSEIGIEKPETTASAPPTEPVQKPAAQETPVPAASDPSGAYMVQLGVYSQEFKANEQARIFSSTIGRNAVVFPKQSGGRTVYAVAFDGFSDEESAKSFGGQLKSRYNLDWFVVKR